MTELSISVVGANVVRQGLQDLSKEIPDIGRLQIYRTAQAIVKRMKVYPPERPGQTYVRTYRLRNGWQITNRENKGLGGYTVSNATPYTKYVVGNAYGLEQAWMHVDRWQVFRDVNDDEVAKLPSEIDKNISQVARRLGF